MNKPLFLLLFFLKLFLSSFAQAKMNAILIDSAGNQITISEAKNLNLKNFKYLIITKKYIDTVFERKEYNFNGPIITLTYYRDSALTVKHGRYLEYYPNGFLFKEGRFVKNKKEGAWIIYDKDAKPLYTYRYLHDSLISQEDYDSKNDLIDSPAHYNGGDTIFSHLIAANIDSLIRKNIIKTEGYARIRFMIDIYGKMKNLYLLKSYSFVFDEICLKILHSIPENWIAATNNGMKVFAYFEQPIAVKFKNEHSIY